MEHIKTDSNWVLVLIGSRPCEWLAVDGVGEGGRWLISGISTLTLSACCSPSNCWLLQWWMEWHHCHVCWGVSCTCFEGRHGMWTRSVGIVRLSSKCFDSRTQMFFPLQVHWLFSVTAVRVLALYSSCHVHWSGSCCHGCLCKTEECRFSPLSQNSNRLNSTFTYTVYSRPSFCLF